MRRHAVAMAREPRPRPSESARETTQVTPQRGSITSRRIRITCNLPFEPDPEQVALALDFLTGPWPFGFVPLGRLWGISLHGTDIDRSWGKGAEIRGPAAALMMAVSGRTALLDNLDGPGLPLLHQRLLSA
jgi:hypothetical protein